MFYCTDQGSRMVGKYMVMLLLGCNIVSLAYAEEKKLPEGYNIPKTTGVIEDGAQIRYDSRDNRFGRYKLDTKEKRKKAEKALKERERKWKDMDPDRLEEIRERWEHLDPLMSRNTK